MYFNKLIRTVIFICAINSSIQFICDDSNNSTLCIRNGTNLCCPIIDGVCCENSDYCCPKDFKCDSLNKICISEDYYMPFHLKLKAIDEKLTLKNEKLCSDQKTKCLISQTCCLNKDKIMGCCPVSDAICCDDQVHCCPKNYKCNPKKGKCDRKKRDLDNIEWVIDSIKWLKKLPGKQHIVSNVVCPDNLSECPADTTCCQLDDGQYGCCPIPNALCCTDHIHCCPENYKCDVKAGRCNKGSVSLPFYTKTKAIKKNFVSNVVCPDGISTCPTESTCCKMGSGQFACCPLPKATCCSDQLHCCPNGFTCDLENAKCKNKEIEIPFYKKNDSTQIPKKKSDDSICPDAMSRCAPETTCCKLNNGNWGCCPLADAICCNDHIHCCPKGYVCDAEANTCNNGQISIPLYKKTESFQINETKILKSKKDNLLSVVCPDGSSFCPKDNTCCKMFDGSYGCCPINNAMCCNDKLHCCPSNTKCNVEKGTCDTDTINIQWFNKTKATKMNPKSKELTIIQAPLTCPDNTTCDSRNTCCKQGDESYGCCPYTNGVCCKNSAFCCPQNSECGPKIGDCTPKTFKQIPLNYSQRIKINIHNQTNCFKSDGLIEPCPYRNGTCCGIHGYCCPDGYRCDPKAESCTLIDPDNKIIKPFIIYDKTLNKKTSRHRIKLFQDLKSVECEDAIHYCPDTYSCCAKKYENGKKYGCCPVKNAVCCDDGINCCPQGYECSNDEFTSCKKKN